METINVSVVLKDGSKVRGKMLKESLGFLQSTGIAERSKIVLLTEKRNEIVFNAHNVMYVMTEV